MTDNKATNVYDDGNIPDVDLPQGEDKTSSRNSVTSCHLTKSNKGTQKPDYNNVEPLPESKRPRKDGPGGD